MFKKDPDERMNLLNKFSKISYDLKNRLTGWSEWAKEFNTAQPSTKEIQKDILHDARKHGYW